MRRKEIASEMPRQVILRVWGCPSLPSCLCGQLDKPTRCVTPGRGRAASLPGSPTPPLIEQVTRTNTVLSGLSLPTCKTRESALLLKNPGFQILPTPLLRSGQLSPTLHPTLQPLYGEVRTPSSRPASWSRVSLQAIATPTGPRPPLAPPRRVTFSAGAQQAAPDPFHRDMTPPTRGMPARPQRPTSQGPCPSPSRPPAWTWLVQNRR